MKKNMLDVMNVVSVCSKHTDERITNVQQDLENTLKAIEDQIKTKGESYVKFGFSQKGKTNENMWVKVKKVDRNKRVLKGELDNVPFSLTNIKCGDKVERSFDEIVAVF